MYSIKKWIASKISNNPSNDDTGLNGEFSSEPGRSNVFNSNYSNLEQSSSQQLPFDVSNGAKTILQFYYSDDELNLIASELESFDGRRDPLRCTELVSQLRIAQDKVMQLLFQLMDEWNCARAPRDYRLKFPEDLLNDSENGESFNGQIWFSAECLASGSDIMNHEAESDMLRPLAKILTNNLDQLRIMLRQSSNEITNKVKFYQDLIYRMEQFDRMFSAFEFEYVKAMLPIKSVEDIEKQQELTVLFSEALGFALKRNLIAQIDVDEFNPSVMIATPRLAIVHGLVRCGNDNPLFRRHKHNLSNMFKSYHRPNVTTDDPMMQDEIDASFKKITKRIKRCVSQLLVKKQENMDLIYDNNNFDDELNRFNRPTCENSQYHNQHFLNVNQAQQFNNSLATSSQQSNSLTGSPSSVDSYEISLALNARGSNYISATAKQLLHKLFVSISCIADQLQSNFASDLRQILKLVFTLHTNTVDEADNASLEEAEEALESTNFTTNSNKMSNFEEMLNNSENLQILFSTTLNAIENAQITNNPDNLLPREETVDDLIDFNNLPDYNGEINNIYENDIYGNYSNDYNNHQSSLNSSANHNEATDQESRKLQPTWAPDESTNECTRCTSSFTLFNRRHHCRACGQIFCKNCSRRSICLPHFGLFKPVRVCEHCYLLTTCDSNQRSTLR